MTFEKWVDWVFSDQKTWDSAWDNGYRDPEPEQALEYVTRLFNNCDELLECCPDQWVNDGLWRILSSGETEMFNALYNATCSWELRRDAIRSMESVFRKLFAERCTPHLGHLSEEGSPINMACYMWWDISLLYGANPGDPCPQETNPELLGVMQRTLAVDHDAVRESALHGLGHWAQYWPKEVEAIIDGCLKESADGLRPELKQYALNARSGCVL